VEKQKLWYLGRMPIEAGARPGDQRREKQREEKFLPGGQRNALKRLISAKRIQGNQSLFL
jgi:hypothetical protein